MFPMMDSNDNENYSYSQNAKISGTSKGAIPKVAAIKLQNQFNNNNNIADQENLMPRVNGVNSEHDRDTPNAQVTNGTDCSNTVVNTADSTTTESSDNQLNGKEELSLVNELYAIEEQPTKDDSDDGEGEFSDNNSIGNLSYISENGLIEEIILLPNNIYSDEENGSASDDCVYAYRGDDHAPVLLENRDHTVDDETDFLEMDFDPEPSSEIENLLEHQELDVNSFHPARKVERLSLNENEKSPTKSPNFENDSISRRQEEPPDEMDGVAAFRLPAPEIRKTGTIPKIIATQNLPEERHKLLTSAKTKTNAKGLKLDLELCTESNDHKRYNYTYYNHHEVTDDVENTCLDCTEKEYLMQTKQDLSIQKVCRSCHSRNLSHGAQSISGDFYSEAAQSLNSSNSETDLMSARAEQIVLQALNKINELKATPPSLGVSRSMEDFCVELEADHQKDQEVPVDFTQDFCSENTVTIYTLNCGELTIIEALTRIGVSPNLDVLRRYFTEQYTIDTTKMNIPQYLLYMSKRDCNFRKLIETIKSCCDEPLDVQYYPLDPFSDTPEIVQINSAEIAKRWSDTTNLRQIINFKHKHFHTLNVLGKVVNILRQPSRGLHTNHIINIPQYYKSGSITITRIT